MIDTRQIIRCMLYLEFSISMIVGLLGNSKRKTRLFVQGLVLRSGEAEPCSNSKDSEQKAGDICKCSGQGNNYLAEKD